MGGQGSFTTTASAEEIKTYTCPASCFDILFLVSRASVHRRLLYKSQCCYRSGHSCVVYASSDQQALRPRLEDPYRVQDSLEYIPAHAMGKPLPQSDHRPTCETLGVSAVLACCWPRYIKNNFRSQQLSAQGRSRGRRRWAHAWSISRPSEKPSGTTGARGASLFARRLVHTTRRARGLFLRDKA